MNIKKIINTSNIIFFILIIIYLIISLNMITVGQNWGDDFASYIMQAESLLSGSTNNFFTNNSYTIYNSDSVVGPVVYPWGFPIILAIIIYFFDINLLALKMPNFIFFILFLFVFYKLLKNRFTSLEKFIVMAVVAFNPHYLLFHDNILSDIPFLFFSFLSLFLMDRFLNKEKLFISSPIHAFILGLIIFLSALIRTVGIVLIITCFIYHTYLFISNWNRTIKNKKEVIFSFIPYLTFVLFWIITSIVLPSGETSYSLSYDNNLINFQNLVKGNFNYYFELLSNYFSGIPFRDTFYGFILTFFVLGIVSRRKTDYLFIIFSIIQIVVLIIWPAQQGLRLMFPVIPFFIYFSFHGMKTTLINNQEINNKVGLRFTYFFWIIIAIIFLGKSGSFVVSNLEAGRNIEGPYDDFSMEIYSFIQDKTSEDSVIIFHKPRILRMMTNRNTVTVMSCERLVIGDYLVLLKGGILIDIFSDCPQIKEKTFENKNFLIYLLN